MWLPTDMTVVVVTIVVLAFAVPVVAMGAAVAMVAVMLSCSTPCSPGVRRYLTRDTRFST